jgi:butyryl-CoA dehydrogenase
VPNDVQVAGLVHKIGWRALPSVILSLGEADACEGWLVGEPHQGLRYMFQMMNEARLLVGLHGVATASVAYQEALAYAQVRTQGRPLSHKQTTDGPQVPIIEHTDVRRMLLRQKAIVEGGLSLVAAAARYADLAAHAPDESERRRARLLLDLLTPVAKSFPAEWGFEANALAVQVHGGYGYSSEYLPESWLRDQKLNSIHEGTTGIQGQDLLGRKAVAGAGAALVALRDEVEVTLARAGKAGVAAEDLAAMRAALDEVAEVTATLGAVGLAGELDTMLRHSTDYLYAFAVVVVAWQWLAQAAAAREGLAARPEHRAFYEGKLCAASYWLATELPRSRHWLALCRSNEDSYARMRPEWF